MAMLKSLSFDEFSRACSQIKTMCRFCLAPPERVDSMEELDTMDRVVVFRCHGDRDVFRMTRTDEFRYLRYTELESLVHRWPRLAFDRYTMIPLPPTMGADYDPDEANETWAAFRHYDFRG